MILSPSMRLRLLWTSMACVALLCTATAPLPVALADEVATDNTPEVVEPLIGADAFAGQTVRDREMGMKLIQARGKKVPRVGQMAPDFELRSGDGKQTIRLSSFRGGKPVVLIFGSHT